MLRKTPHNLGLLLRRQTRNSHLNNPADTTLINRNKTLIVHERKEPHNKLTIHTVGHTAMARDGVAKVLDVEGTFETRGEKAAEGGDEGGEGGHGEDVELHGGDGEGGGERPGGGGVGG